MSTQSDLAHDPAGSVPPLGLEGAWNDRDSATLAGTAPGVLLRSSALFNLTEAGQQRLLDLGVSDVVDLRDPREVAANGADRVPAGVTVHQLPISAGGQLAGAIAQGDAGAQSSMADAMSQFAAMLQQGDPRQLMVQFMEQTYVSIVTDGPSLRQLGATLEVIARAEGAVLVHCSAGKDRTGLAVALAGLVAGAEVADVTRDYLYSNHAADQQGEVATVPGLDADALAPLRGVDVDHLEAARTAALGEFGDLDGLLTAAGVHTETRTRVAQRLAR